MSRLFKTKLFTTSMLVAPTIFMLGAAQPASASCAVTSGGGTVANPANGSTITCFDGTPRTTPIGSGTDGISASVNLRHDALVQMSSPTEAVRIDNVTLTLDANSLISSTGNYNTVLSLAGGALDSRVNVTLFGDNSRISTNKYSRGGLRS